jgi:hypothetical protein
MKTKTIKTAVVRETGSIDTMFKRNSLGYLESAKKVEISMADAVGYVVTKLDAGQSAMREAILFTGWVFKNKPEAESKAFADELKTRWSGSTIPNLVSIAKALPSFEEKGLAVDKVRDLYGLREVSKLLKSEDGHKAVALLNEGMSPRALKKEIGSPRTGGSREPKEEVSEPINIGNETEKLAALLLGYADKFAKLAENEDRLKIARQIVAKLNLGGYLLMHADAAAAVQTLKAKK